MNVLVLNSGSSSLKFEVVSGTGGRPLRGTIERIGADAALTFNTEAGAGLQTRVPITDHAAAVQRALDWLAQSDVVIDAVGHRVVHGGERFTAAAVIDPEVTAAIEALEPLAPLHNVPALAGIRAAAARLGPRVPMVAVFDTAFHASLPEHAARYAIPYEMSLRHGVRRYGFHGIAYRSVVEGYARLTGRRPEEVTIVALHLGNGCSAAAIQFGRSIDTSMGLTPLEGLVMGTRSGDVDPALVRYLAEREEVDAAQVEAWLNERSGLLGVSGSSGDMRDIVERQRQDRRARLAFDIFCYRARKYVGAYLAALGGAEAVVFSGGIGAHTPLVRERICAGLEWLGLALDAERNAVTLGEPARISADGGRLAAWVIPADEASVIARETVECLTRTRTGTPA